MTDIPDLIARVRELDKAATKGPWVAPHAHVQQKQAGYVYRAEGMASQAARTMSTTRGMCDAALIAYRVAAYVSVGMRALCGRRILEGC